MIARPAILITRPEPGGQETARRVAALGWRPLLAPALVLAPRSVRFPRAQALLLTSRAAARALPPAMLWGRHPAAAEAPDPQRPAAPPPPATLPVFAVGEATAAEARACGWANVTAAAGDAAALAALVAARLRPADGPLLLAVGQGYGAELASSLRASGFSVLRRVAYAATPAAALPEQARVALHQGVIAAALFFSPRTAQTCQALMQGAGLAATARSIRALAISPRVAQALKALPWREIAVAARPDQDCLLELLGPAVKHE